MTGNGTEEAFVAFDALHRVARVCIEYPNDPASMIDAFTYLTDVEPLHDGGPGIQQPDRSLYRGRHNPSLESGH